MSTYLTAPVQSEKMPTGIPYIIGNECAERFSFYGMKSILFVFMTQHLLASDGSPALMTQTEGREAMAWFVAGAYFFPLIGAVIADAVFGKYLTIIALSLFYCVGHGLMACMDLPNPILQATLEPKTFMFLGLFLIAMGAGGIKPCVSAHVGDQFGDTNKHLLERVFGWFYFSINLGAFASYILTPILLDRFGPGWAFGVPGVLMAAATLVFWMGRTKFVHIPSRGAAFVRESFTGEGLRVILKLVPIYCFVAVFWSLYSQTGGAWVGQAVEMDRTLFGIEWLESQVGAINPLLILIYIPIFSYFIFPQVGRMVNITPLRKLGVGFFITAAAFAVSAIIQSWLDGGATPSIGWQFLAYAIITAAEILVSVTCLEFSYTQAPPQMKSFIMALYFLSISAGNIFTAMVNRLTMDAAGNSTLVGAQYYWFFTGLMVVAAVLFIPAAIAYKPKTYMQEEAAVA